MGGKVDQVTLCANAFLEAMAEVTIAHLLLEAAVIAETKKAADTDEPDQGGDDDFYAGKVMAAKFYVNFVLPGVHAKTAVDRDRRPQRARHPRPRILDGGLTRPRCDPADQRWPGRTVRPMK